MEFIQKDPSVVLAETLEYLEREANIEIAPASPERLLVDLMVYREILLLNQMEFLMKQNFVQTATGERLDYWGGLFSIERTKDETDDNYRQRLLGGVSNRLAVGTKKAYRDKIISLPLVLDALVENTADDVGVLAGQIRLTVLTSDINLTDIQKVEIKQMLQTDIFGMIGDEFVYREVESVPIDGSVIVYKDLGVDTTELTQKIDDKMTEYFDSLKTNFNKPFGVNDLERKLLQVEGVSRIQQLDFANIPVLKSGQIHVKGAIQITVQ